MNLNTSGIKKGKGVAATAGREVELSESALAVQEFASLIRQATPRHRQATNRAASYEVRPCARVRGYVLRLPVIGWTLWYPTADAAKDFAEKLAAIYRAECRIYDVDGSLDQPLTKS